VSFGWASQQVLRTARSLVRGRIPEFAYVSANAVVNNFAVARSQLWIYPQ
jgi:hypothetical protein